MERKRLVVDANILIRGCLGVRVRTLIANYADRVDFFVAEANLAEAADYIADLANEKNLDEAVCTEALISLMRVVQLVENRVLESARNEALARIRDPDRWPLPPCPHAGQDGPRTLPLRAAHKTGHRGHR